MRPIMREPQLARRFALPAIACFLGSCLANPIVVAQEISPSELAMVKQAESQRIATIAKVYDAVVAVYGADRNGGGSGVIFHPDGFALTNYHVVQGAGTTGFAGLADGKMYNWDLVGIDPGGDLAIIRLKGKKAFPFAPIGDSDKVHVGDWAMAMGNPFLLAEDQKPTVTLGVVSGVKRFQAGVGLNELVYGNCIQVDSSINPGNSGGPLFNMSGEIIGINGRGSFKARGRVNVGLGYAISTNQIKRFIPDLMATRMVQHGTLDALFGNRGGKVVCYTLNLDSPAAQRGLQLGDELVEFQGQPITHANQLTNMISTLPADWPVTFTVRREGETETISVRLLALPYSPKKKKEEPEEDDEGEKEEKPPKIKIEAEPEEDDTPAGEFRDEALNRKHAHWVLEQWQQQSGVNEIDDAVLGYELNDSISLGDTELGKQTVTILRSGRFRIERTVRGQTDLYAFDGENYWQKLGDAAAKKIPRDRALREPSFAEGAALATLFEDKPTQGWGNAQLDGGDLCQNKTAYRIKVTDDNGDWHYLWLSVLGSNGDSNVMLLKSGADINGDEAVLFSDWEKNDSFWMPHRRTLVNGLAENSDLQATTTSHRELKTVEEKQFELPK